MTKWVSGCAFVLLASAAQAQSSSKDFAAWQGIMFTPVGAFPGIEPSLAGRTDDSKQLAIRASTWKFAIGDDRMSSLGVSYFAPPSSPVRYGATLGWTEPSDGDGIFLGGLEVAGDFLQRGSQSGTGAAFGIDWKLSAGMGQFSGSVGGTIWSIVGQLPIQWKMRMASTSELSLHVTPGFGLAGLGDSGSEEAESGTRPMIGFGGAFTSARGIGIHLGTQLVPLDLGPSADSAPWVIGAALSFPIGGKN